MSRPHQRRVSSEPVALHSQSAEETRQLGVLLGGLLRADDVVLLYGGLGAGKTAFTQGIGQGLEVAGVINSPTFTLLKEYTGRLALYHFDLYRIEDPAELEALGFREYFGSGGVAVVEWAERGESPGSEPPWPRDGVRITLVPAGESERVLQCTAVGTRGGELLVAFASAVLAAEVA
jgi:tRNA threonylcarbamoyladenosine biosynthesis protein TsaE